MGKGTKWYDGTYTWSAPDDKAAQRCEDFVLWDGSTDFSDETAIRDRTGTSHGGGGNMLVCRMCGQRITTKGSRIEIGGKHTHVFFNPQGQVFEVGCFDLASGLVGGGPPTMEFTWFPGYTWQTVGCSTCASHMGWAYANESGNGFFGLILATLREEKGDDAGG